jgi:prepilin-type N-terminal cleavage/methylation domain-containing protein
MKITAPVFHRQGFTLVEIMIVVAIIGLLAAIAIPNFVKARATSQANACINNLRKIDDAASQFAIEQGKSTGDHVSLNRDLTPENFPSAPRAEPTASRTSATTRIVPLATTSLLATSCRDGRRSHILSLSGSKSRGENTASLSEG